MSSHAEPTEHELREMLAETESLIAEAQGSRSELEQLGYQLQMLLEAGSQSRFCYDVQTEQLRRSYEKNRRQLLELERRRKQLIYALGRL